jgi:hypothetical protein
MPYGKGVEWVQEHYAIPTSVGGLQRWWRRQSNRRLRDEVRNGIAASKSYDIAVDETVLDARMAKALKENFFALTARGDPAAALDFATLALKANKGKQDAERLTRSYRRARENGQLTDAAADSLCIQLLGEHPLLVFGEDWLLPDEELDDEPDGAW